MVRKNNLRNFSLSNDAKRDLYLIRLYGERRFGVTRSHLFLAELKQLFQLLREPYCLLGTHRNEIKPNLYSYPFKHYSLYFYRSSTDIYILRILRDEQDQLSAFI